MYTFLTILLENVDDMKKNNLFYIDTVIPKTIFFSPYCYSHLIIWDEQYYLVLKTSFRQANKHRKISF